MAAEDRLPGEVKNGVTIIRIAISCFGEEVAPCFDTAHRFRYWEIINGEAATYRELVVGDTEGIARVKLIKQVAAHVLICNGIAERLREMLEAEGCVVIDGVIGSASDALFGFLAGQIKPQPRNNALRPDQMQPHTADLVTWTEDLFQGLGWTVRKVHQDSLFPIDLCVERDCPFCGKTVRAAVCCGAHAYRIDEEIQELKRVTAAGYAARVYVHHAVPGISRLCCDFDIELLDPRDFINGQANEQARITLPPLKGPIAGHEALNKGS